MGSLPNLQDHWGQIVAFEGDTDTIATQLQLIPFSSKILIISSLESSLPRPKPSTVFDAHSYIYDVHTALTARIERARAFLKLSTPTQPRLVFLNGGTVCARTACVRAICDNATDGDVREAERQFNEVVKDGVDGLLRGQPIPKEEEGEGEGKEQQRQRQQQQRLETGISNTANRVEETAAAASIPPEQPAVRTVRSITPDIQTRGLAFQEFGFPSPSPFTSSQSTNLMVEDRPESVVVNEAPPWEALTPKENLTSRMEKRTTFGGQIPSPVARKLRDTDEDEHSGDDSDLDDFTSALNSALVTEEVVFGEAYIVDVPSRYQTASNKRTKSAETIDVTITKPPDGTFGPGSPESGASGSPIVMRPFTSDGRLQRKPSLSLFQLPRTTYEGSPVAIEKALLPSASIESPGEESRPLGRRGTFSEDSAIDVTAGSSGKSHESLACEPVFALLEDLVIQFKDGSSDEILDSIIASYKDGSYPIILKRRTLLVPSPTSAVFAPGHEPSVPILSVDITVEMDEERSYRSQGSNSHLADRESYLSEPKQLWLPSNDFGRSSGELRAFAGLSAQTITPPPTASGISNKFCDFTYTNSSNAVHIQDSLRAVLDSYFPTNEAGYSQGFNLIATGTDRLWKPVFGSIDDSTGSQRTTVDQIIAFGHEDGVDTDFFAHISGQIEALGMKKNGINKAGKLDLRYLVANILQTADEQSRRSGVKPWSNTKALATMLVPHLESYLASNPMIGLLILHYPITHLSTILALRKLIGADLFKVAGILDGLSSEPTFEDQPATLSSDLPLRTRSILHRGRTDSIHSHCTQTSFSTRSTSQLPAQLRNRLSVISLSKADYLIPSTASPAEIKSLLSSIAQGLIERSSFYIPEPDPSPAFSKSIIPPIPDSPSESDRVSHSRKKSRSRSNYTHSIRSTRTTASERIRREEARERQLEKDWENFYLGEDSEDDYDRMVMGRSCDVVIPELRKKGRLEEMTKAGGKKAFKWLGLA